MSKNDIRVYFAEKTLKPASKIASTFGFGKNMVTGMFDMSSAKTVKALQNSNYVIHNKGFVYENPNSLVQAGRNLQVKGEINPYFSLHSIQIPHKKLKEIFK